MAADMEDFYALFVVSLDRYSWEEHMCHLSESESGVRIDENDLGRCNIDVPLRKVCAHQNEKIDDVWETKRDTGEQDRIKTHTF